MNRSMKDSKSVSNNSNESESSKCSVVKKTDHQDWRETTSAFARSMCRWPFHNPFECVEFIPAEYSERLKDLLPEEDENKTGT